MSTYTIGEAAVSSGFRPSALRFYESIGLVEPAARTDAGYRLYDDRGLARLAFIGRAKRLGCSLDEITDLVSVWDGEQCDLVQQRFHQLVTAKLGATRRQIAELTALTGQLQTAASRLAGSTVDGPCDDGCACSSATAEQVPIACTLDASAIPDRLDDWRSVLARAKTRTSVTGGGVRLEFDAGMAVDDLARLVAAEQQCCAFFSFTITVDADGVALEVQAPDGATDMVTALFGTA
jgi:DNA-binding transcriptional MerR regulator